MNVDKKLAMFRKVVMQEVEKKRAKAASEMGEAFTAAVDEAERAAQRNAQERIQTERFKIDRMKNRESVTASAEAKRSIIELRERLTDALFTDVLSDVAAFIGSEEYGEYLLNAISNANAQVSVIRRSFVYAQVRRADMALAGRIKEMTGLIAETADDIELGGFRLISGNRKVIDDRTLASRVKEARRYFVVSNAAEAAGD